MIVHRLMPVLQTKTMLLVPGLLIIGALLIVPIVWLLGLSFVSEGRLSLEHYQRQLARTWR